MGRIRRFLAGGLTLVLLMGTFVYPFLLYTTVPFVSYWRTIFIETAMSTLSHQWLATMFIPQDIIDNVMKGRYLTEAKQESAATVWNEQTALSSNNKTEATTTTQKSTDPFDILMEQFDELDRASLQKYLAKRPEAMDDGAANVNIDHCDEDDSETGIVTTQGDNVMALNAKAGILIVEVKGENYNGRLAIIKDPASVSVGTSPDVFEDGAYVRTIAKHNDAILAINASGFEDPDGSGSGGQPYGFLKSNNEKLQDAVGDAYKIIGFDKANQLYIGRYDDTTFLRDGVEFSPALIINGQSLVEDSSGWGLQPRSSIGQKQDGTVLLLVIDGRQPGHSLGVTVSECASILKKYDAVQASNLDGGSSSVMYYNGREITQPTTASNNPKGRHLPDAFIVKTADSETSPIGTNKAD